MVEAKDETGDYGKVRETIADLLSETPDMGCVRRNLNLC